MHKARTFFFVCAGLLCLAIAYHLGARSAGAQAGSTVTGMCWTDPGAGIVVMTANGECYFRHNEGSSPYGPFVGQLYPLGNYWSGAPTPAAQPTWGQVKAKYAPPAPGKAVAPGKVTR